MNSTPPLGPPHHENFPPGELHHEAPGIEFMVEDAPDFELSDAESLLDWIERVARVHEHRIVQLTYIFCSDDYLHRLNLQYLDHDTLTDVITFDNSDDADILEGDIFISVERVRDNAQDLGIPFRDAHAVVGAAVRIAVERGCELKDLSLAELQALEPLIRRLGQDG